LFACSVHFADQCVKSIVDKLEEIFKYSQVLNHCMFYRWILQPKFNSLPLPGNTLVSVRVWFFRHLALGAFTAIRRHNAVR